MGEIDGAGDGAVGVALDGFHVGLSEGEAEGTCVGIRDGDIVGAIDGLVVGMSDEEY